MKIVLASESPRRIEMMGWLGNPFKCVSPDLDESKIRDKNPERLTRKLAEAKALSAAKNLRNSIVIGSDAVVSFKNKIIKKPKDVNDQRRMLKLQRGKKAEVVTSVCLINTKTGEKITETKKTKYTMANISDADLEAYIKTGIGLTRAGGYGQQDENGKFIGSEFDCYPNSIGFPICVVVQMLKKMGIKIDIDIMKVVRQKTGKKC